MHHTGVNTNSYHLHIAAGTRGPSLDGNSKDSHWSDGGPEIRYLANQLHALRSIQKDINLQAIAL